VPTLLVGHVAPTQVWSHSNHDLDLCRVWAQFMHVLLPEFIITTTVRNFCCLWLSSLPSHYEGRLTVCQSVSPSVCQSVSPSVRQSVSPRFYI